MVQDVQPEDDEMVEAEEADMVPLRQQCKPHIPPEHLSVDQWRQLGELQQLFPTLFSEKPGLTNVITHKIVLKDPKPVRLKPYRVPE